MIRYLYAIFDEIVGEYGPMIMIFKNEKLAVRTFVENIGKLPYPNDSELHCLGTINIENGVINNDIRVLKGLDLAIDKKMDLEDMK